MSEEQKELIGGRFMVNFTLDYKGSPGSTNSGEVKTKPNMSLTVGQLLERHHKTGQFGTDVTRTPIYFEMEIPTIDDITDVEEYRKYLLDKADKVQEFIKEEVIRKKQEEEELEKERLQKEQRELIRNPEEETPKE